MPGTLPKWIYRTWRYLRATPSGRSIQALGIEPDIFVETGTIQLTSDAARRREEDLRGRLDSELEGSDAANAGDDSTVTVSDEEIEKDYQLQRALDLIRGVALFENTVS